MIVDVIPWMPSTRATSAFVGPFANHGQTVDVIPWMPSTRATARFARRLPDLIHSIESSGGAARGRAPSSGPIDAAAYSLPPEVAMPSTNCFWKIRYSTIIGRQAMVAAAISCG